MVIPIDKVEKIDKLIHSIEDIDVKDWLIGEKYTHIRAVDKDGDKFEITFTPNPSKR